MDEKKKSEVSILLEYVKVIVLTMIATFILLQFIQVSRVNGSSMENTYFQNNIVLIDKVFYKHSQPKRNDIIIVDYDENEISDYKEILWSEIFVVNMWRKLS